MQATVTVVNGLGTPVQGATASATTNASGVAATPPRKSAGLRYDWPLCCERLLWRHRLRERSGPPIQLLEELGLVRYQPVRGGLG